MAQQHEFPELAKFIGTDLVPKFAVRFPSLPYWFIVDAVMLSAWDAV